MDPSRLVRGAPSRTENELLRRCIVGKFRNHPQELSILNDARRWACKLWKPGNGVNGFAMNDGQFLFELPSRVAAEHVLAGRWVWKKTPVDMQWWSPTIGCWPTEIVRDWVWIRILLLPLSLWSKETFIKIRDMWGGFLETEEETSLKNHLHWARIKVKGDGGRVPKQIEVTEGGFAYTIPVWCEISVTVRKVETLKEGVSHYPKVKRGD